VMKQSHTTLLALAGASILACSTPEGPDPADTESGLETRPTRRVAALVKDRRAARARRRSTSSSIPKWITST
jgi:hypothetical protein